MLTTCRRDADYLLPLTFELRSREGNVLPKAFA